MYINTFVESEHVQALGGEMTPWPKIIGVSAFTMRGLPSTLVRPIVLSTLEVTWRFPESWGVPPVIILISRWDVPRNKPTMFTWEVSQVMGVTPKSS